MKSYGPYTVSQFLSPASSLRFKVDSNIEYFTIQNNSPYQLNIEPGGSEMINFPEFLRQDIKVSQASGTFNGQMTIQPVVNITGTTRGTSNTLWIFTYTKGELPQAQVIQLSPPAIIATATGKPIFSATVGFGATTTIGQNLNVFNPPNSGVVMEFHSAKFYTNDSTGPTGNVYTLLTGGDLNFSTPVSAVSHDAIEPLPVSVAHCTAVDSSSFISFTTNPETINLQQMVTQDALSFPDHIKLYPGGNLFIQVVSGTTNHVVRLTLKWTEDVYTPPILGVNLGLIANQIINEGNPLQPVLQATKQGDTAEDILINNDGTLTSKGIATFNALLKALGGIQFPTIGTISAGFQMIGDTTIANAGTSVSHLLGVTPKVILPVLDAGAAGVADVIKINYGTANSTSFTAYSTNAAGTGNVRFFLLA